MLNFKGILTADELDILRLWARLENSAASSPLAAPDQNSADSGGSITCTQCGRRFPLNYATKAASSRRDCPGFAWANYRRHLKTHGPAQPSLINEDAGIIPTPEEVADIKERRRAWR